MLYSRVASSEICGGKFIIIFPEIAENLLITYVNLLFPSPALQSGAVKERSMFLTNNSPDLYALTLCIMFTTK